MGKKIIIILLILIIVYIAYQFINVRIENATLDRQLFAVLAMYKKRMNMGAGTKPNIEDMRQDAHKEFKLLNININPKDIQVEVNFEEDFLAFRARYMRAISLIVYTHYTMMNVDVRCDLE